MKISNTEAEQLKANEKIIDDYRRDGIGYIIMEGLVIPETHFIYKAYYDNLSAWEAESRKINWIDESIYEQEDQKPDYVINETVIVSLSDFE